MLNLQAAAVTVPEEQVLEFTLGTTQNCSTRWVQTEATINLPDGSSSEGGAFVFDQPVAMLADSVYYFRIANLTEGGKVILSGSGVANEGPGIWDYPSRWTGTAATTVFTSASWNWACIQMTTRRSSPTSWRF